MFRERGREGEREGSCREEERETDEKEKEKQTCLSSVQTLITESRLALKNPDRFRAKKHIEVRL